MLRLIPLLLLLMLFTTCRKDKAFPPCEDFLNPDCPNYDPCYGKNKVKADFTSYNIYLPPNYVLSDSVIFSVGHFLAEPNESASYTWIFDNLDTLRGNLVDYGYCSNGCALTESDTGLHTVKLIVRNLCSSRPNDVDSVIKSIFYKLPEKAYMCGTYKGALDSNPTDSFLVTIAYKPNPFVYNIHNDSNYHTNGLWLVQDREMEIRHDWSFNAGLYQLKADVNPSTKIIAVDFSMEDINTPGTIIETNHFRGIKLN